MAITPNSWARTRSSPARAATPALNAIGDGWTRVVLNLGRKIWLSARDVQTARKALRVLISHKWVSAAEEVPVTVDVIQDEPESFRIDTVRDFLKAA
jgi:hypothetical protein